MYIYIYIYVSINVKRGLFRGGGFEFVGIQLLGAVVLVSWAGFITLFLFSFMRATVGIRVTPEDEAKGAGAIEHLCDPEHYCHQEPDSSATQE
jgi:ammonia channel protein AmtB